MRSKPDNLMRCLLGFFVLGLLLAPMPAQASGAEARRQYIAGDYEAALRTALPAAEKGDATAMLVLGALYHDGNSISRDDKVALQWWRAAAELGNSRAQNNIGHMYLEGFGVERNYEEATRWLELSASRNEAYAYLNLGYMYEYGRGFGINYNRSLEMYRESQRLFTGELATDPENEAKIKSNIALLARKISTVSNLLTKQTSATPQSGGGHQTTPNCCRSERR